MHIKVVEVRTDTVRNDPPFNSELDRLDFHIILLHSKSALERHHCLINGNFSVRCISWLETPPAFNDVPHIMKFTSVLWAAIIAEVKKLLDLSEAM